MTTRFAGRSTPVRPQRICFLITEPPSKVLAIGEVLDQEPVGTDLWIMKLRVPSVGVRAVPGQFVHLRVADTMLRRPFSVYRADAEGIELLYRVKGKGTRLMATWNRGARVDLLGPLGSAFAPRRKGERILLVGGGVGVAPLVFFAGRFPGAGLALLGFRTRMEVCGGERIDETPMELIITTTDGSRGLPGLVTDRLDEGRNFGQFDRILTCGPWGMMALVANWAQQRGLPCEAALEREMGCGIGACLGCVVPMRDASRPYSRVCTEGPVMDSRTVQWGL